MLTPFAKYFKEYSMYVLMELGPRGRETTSRAITISLSPQCGGYNRALRNENLLSPLFPIGGVKAVVTNDWCITEHDQL